MFSEILRKYINPHRKILLLFTTLILIGLVLRLYQFDGFSTFLGDQGRDAVIIKGIATLESFPSYGAPSSIGAVRLGPFYYYLMAPFLLLFNLNPIGIAYGILILSMLGTILIFPIVKKEINGVVAILLTFLIVFSYQFIDTSRNAWNPNLLPYFSFFTLYFGYRIVKYEKMRDALILGLLFSAATQLHPLAFLIAIPLSIFVFYHLYVSKKKINFVKNLCAVLVSFLFLYIPLIQFEINNQFTNLTKLRDLFSKKQLLIEEKSLYVRVIETVTSFLNSSFQIETTSYITVGVFMVLIIGSAIIFKRTKAGLFVWMNLITLILYLALFSLLSTNRHPHYYASIYISFFFLIGYVIHLIPKKYIFYPVAALLGLIFLWINIPHYSFLYNKPNNQYAFAIKIADSFEGKTLDEPIRLAALPATEQSDQYRYYLDVKGINVLPFSSAIAPVELYVICIDPLCDSINDPIWPISSVPNRLKKGKWNIDTVTIHRIVRSIPLSTKGGPYDLNIAFTTTANQKVDKISDNTLRITSTSSDLILTISDYKGNTLKNTLYLAINNIDQLKNYLKSIGQLRSNTQIFKINRYDAFYQYFKYPENSRSDICELYILDHRGSVIRVDNYCIPATDPEITNLVNSIDFKK